MAVMVLDQVTKDELIKEVTDKIISEVGKLLEEGKQRDLAKKEWLTSNEVKQTLKISHTTLWSWSKKGIIKSHKIAGRLRYSSSDILAALKIREHKLG